MPGHHCGRTPRNKGLRYPADPPTVEVIVAVMRTAGHSAHGLRARALIVLLWRRPAHQRDPCSRRKRLDNTDGGVLFRRGKGRQAMPTRRDGPLALAADRALAGASRRAACRRRAVRDRPTHRRTAVVANQPRARLCGTWRSSPGFDGASRLTSSDTRTPSRWHVRASRSTSSSDSSGTPTSGSHRSISKSSSAATSSTPSPRAPRRCSPPAPLCADGPRPQRKRMRPPRLPLECLCAESLVPDPAHVQKTLETASELAQLVGQSHARARWPGSGASGKQSRSCRSVDCARTVCECVPRYRNFDCSGEAALQVAPVTSVRVQESSAPILDAAEGSGLPRQFLCRCGFSQRIAMHQDRSVERFGVINGVDVPAGGDPVVPLRCRDSTLLCAALDTRRCPQVPLASKRDTRALKESSQSSPLVPRRADRNRHLRNHSQPFFHTLCIGGWRRGRDLSFMHSRLTIAGGSLRS